MYTNVYCNIVRRNGLRSVMFFSTVIIGTAMSDRKGCQTCGIQRLLKYFSFTGISCMSCLYMCQKERRKILQ